MHDDAADDDEPQPRGSWLTYRYRLGGDVAVEASGTIKAPSFRSAARRLVDGRLADHVRGGPAYLRLRAAGQEEVLMQARLDAHGAVHLDVVPTGSYQFEEPDLG
jgi:hypothetical protein